MLLLLPLTTYARTMLTTLTALLPAPSTVLYTLLGVLALGLATIIYLYPYTARTIPFRNLPGPEPASGLFGSLLTQQRAEPGTTYSKWVATYGSTLRFRSILGSWRIVSTDLRAAAWVLQHTGQFHRQTGFNAMLDRMFGRGVLMVEDAAHRRQRRVLAPAFSAVNVANMMPVFWDKAYELDKKLELVVRDGEKGGKGAQVDIHLYFMRTALDIIGLAGFNYDFGAAVEADNPLSKSMFAATNGIQKPSIVRVLQIFYPALLPIVSVQPGSDADPSQRASPARSTRTAASRTGWRERLSRRARPSCTTSRSRRRRILARTRSRCLSRRT